MKNIKLEYRYRDYGNNKRHLEVIFPNPDGLSIDKIRRFFEAIRLVAFQIADDAQFSAEALGLPTAYFEGPPNADDHRWHEFVAFAETDDAVTKLGSKSIAHFLFDFACLAHRGGESENGVSLK